MKRIGWAVLVLDLILVNVAAGWWFWGKQKPKRGGGGDKGGLFGGVSDFD